MNFLYLAKQLGVDEKEVRRLLEPHYGSKLPRIAEAVSLLGKRLVIGLEPANLEAHAESCKAPAWVWLGCED